MSYAPTEWKTGDIITAEKLNNMESGIVGSAKVLFVSSDDETGLYNKTWNEIKNALSDGVLCLVVYSDDAYSNINVISAAIPVEGGYGIFYDFPNLQTAEPVAIAETPDGYPAFTDE